MKIILLFFVAVLASCQPAYAAAGGNENLPQYAIQILQFLVLLLTLVGSMVALSRRQEQSFERYINARFDTEAQARKQLEDSVLTMLNSINAKEHSASAKAADVERQVLTLRAELPEKYLRREDYIRGQSVIESKLDALALKMENMQIKGMPL